jgi:hypothetical protein
MSVLNGGAQLGDGYFECGRNTSNITFGTDGDGVNDADEGNVCGPIANGGALCLDLYGPNGQGKNRVIAGNYFNADITTPSPISAILDAANSTTMRFGSDFNGERCLGRNLAINASVLL